MIRGAALALLAALLTGDAAASDTVAEPDSYHGEPYNTPVPATLQGATVIDGVKALTLQAEGVAFVDVYPRVVQPDGLPKGTIWREPRHTSIPGALWLWNTGYKRLTSEEQERLTAGLAQATGGDPRAPVVIFCRADCWMSWNAARRAVDMGYTDVIWFPGGTDAWTDALGDDLIIVEPFLPKADIQLWDHPIGSQAESCCQGVPLP